MVESFVFTSTLKVSVLRIWKTTHAPPPGHNQAAKPSHAAEKTYPPVICHLSSQVKRLGRAWHIVAISTMEHLLRMPQTLVFLA